MLPEFEAAAANDPVFVDSNLSCQK